MDIHNYSIIGKQFRHSPCMFFHFRLYGFRWDLGIEFHFDVFILVWRRKKVPKLGMFLICYLHLYGIFSWRNRKWRNGYAWKFYTGSFVLSKNHFWLFNLSLSLDLIRATVWTKVGYWLRFTCTHLCIVLPWPLPLENCGIPPQQEKSRPGAGRDTSLASI